MKKLAVLWMAAMLSAAFSVTAFAGTELTSLTVSLVEDRADPGTVNSAQLQVSSSNVTIEKAEPSKDYDNWKPGMKITWDVVLTPDDGYVFNLLKLKKVSVQNGEVVSSSIRRPRISMKINYIPKATLESPQNIYYDDNNVAKWDKVPYCDMYEVQIFKENDDGNYVNYKTVKISDRKLDLSAYVTDGSDSYFKVRAIPKNKAQAAYLRDSDWTDSNDISAPSDNTVTGNFSGSGPYMTFTDVQGVLAAGWQKLGGNWYYFDPQNGSHAVSSAWSLINGKWYYFNEAGIMLTGWLKLNQIWYFLDSDGSMQTGWYHSGPGGPWYYLDPASGALWVSAITPDGYSVDENGAWYN